MLRLKVFLSPLIIVSHSIEDNSSRTRFHQAGFITTLTTGLGLVRKFPTFFFVFLLWYLLLLLSLGGLFLSELPFGFLLPPLSVFLSFSSLPISRQPLFIHPHGIVCVATSIPSTSFQLCGVILTVFSISSLIVDIN